MRRREFIAALGSAAAWPVVAGAQQPRMPVIGAIDMGASRQSDDSVRAAWIAGLNDTGFFVDRNVSIETHSANGQVDRLPALVAEFVQRRVALIYGNSDVAAAAKAATSTIPIVFVAPADPVIGGLVKSLNHPGGNVTGVRLRAGVEISAKLIELVHEVLPATTTIGMLNDPKNEQVQMDAEIAEVQAAATSLGLKVVLTETTTEGDLELAIAKVVKAGAGALLIGNTQYLYSLRDQIVRVAMRDRVPIFAGPWLAFGALLSYGASELDLIRQAGIYMGRILKGEKPADLPVLQPTKFQLIVNLKTAKELGVTVPPSLLARADKVIE